MSKLNALQVLNIYTNLVASDVRNGQFVIFLRSYRIKSTGLISNMLIKEFVKLADNIDVTINTEGELNRLGNADKLLIALDLLIHALDSMSHFDYHNIFCGNLLWCNKTTSGKLVRLMHFRYENKYRKNIKRISREQFKENILRHLFEEYAPKIFLLITGNVLSAEAKRQVEVEWGNFVKQHIKNYLRDTENVKISPIAKRAISSLTSYEPLESYVESAMYSEDKLRILNFFLNHRFLSRMNIWDWPKYHKWCYLFIALDIYEKNQLPLPSQYNLSKLLEKIHKISTASHALFNTGFEYSAETKFLTEIDHVLDETILNLFVEAIIRRQDQQLAQEFLQSVSINDVTNTEKFFQIWSKRLAADMVAWLPIFTREVIYLQQIESLLYIKPTREKVYKLDKNKILNLLLAEEDIISYQRTYGKFKQFSEVNKSFIEKIDFISIMLENISNESEHTKSNHDNIDKQILSQIVTDYFVGVDEVELVKRLDVLEQHIGLHSILDNWYKDLSRLAKIDIARVNSLLLPNKEKKDEASSSHGSGLPATNDQLDFVIKSLAVNFSHMAQHIRSSDNTYTNACGETDKSNAQLKRKAVQEEDAVFPVNREKRAQIKYPILESSGEISKFLIDKSLVGTNEKCKGKRASEKSSENNMSSGKLKLG